MTADQADSMGSRIKALLQARGVSQSELATKSGVDRAELNRLVNGRRQARLEEIGWIAEALGVGVEELVGDLELPADLRRALGHFGDLARRMLHVEGERDDARARLAARGEELARERLEREALEQELKRMTRSATQARARRARERVQRRRRSRCFESRLSKADLRAKKLASRNQVLEMEVRRLRNLVTGQPPKIAGDVAATILTIGLLGKSIVPMEKQ